MKTGERRLRSRAKFWSGGWRVRFVLRNELAKRTWIGFVFSELVGWEGGAFAGRREIDSYIMMIEWFGGAKFED